MNRPLRIPSSCRSTALRFRSGALAILLLAAPALAKVTFQDDLLPVIENHCVRCHNPDKIKGDLDLSSYNGIMRGGGSGKVALSGDVEGSPLYKSVAHVEEPFMPPNKPRLSDKELGVFRDWINDGLLESTGSKAVAVKQPALNLSVKNAGPGRPAGPPPMPGELLLEPVVHTPHTTAVTGLAASPWAPLVAVTGQKQILLYNTETLELIGILPVPDGQPWDLKFSRNGRLLLAGGGIGGKMGKAWIWDVSTGDLITEVAQEYDVVLAADINPDQTLVAVGGPERLVKIYDIGTGEVLHKIKSHTDWVVALAFSPDGRMLASADRNGGVSVWDPENGQQLFTQSAHRSRATALSWRDDSKYLATAGEEGAIKWWETEDGREARSFTGHSGGTLAIHFGHDGRMVSAGRDREIRIWKSGGGKERSMPFYGEITVQAVFTHDGERVVGCDWLGRMCVWDAKGGQWLGELDVNPPPLSERIAAAGELLPRLQDVRARMSSMGTSAAGAESRIAGAEAELKEALADRDLKEAEVERLKVLERGKNPPKEIKESLVQARAVRGKARERVGRAEAALKARKNDVDLVKVRSDQSIKRLDQEIAQLESRLARLKAAAGYAPIHALRQALAGQKRERAQMIALAAGHTALVAEMEAGLARAADEEARKELKRRLKESRAELEKAQTTAEKLAKKIEDGERRVGEALAERASRAGAPPGQQARAGE